MTLGDASRLRGAGKLFLIAAASACVTTTDSVAAHERSTLVDAPEALRAEVVADPQPRLWAG